MRRLHFIQGGHIESIESLQKLKNRITGIEMYFRILSTLKSRHDLFDEIIIYLHKEDTHTFPLENITIKTINDFNTIDIAENDFFFIRGDKDYYLPLLKKIKDRNHSLFYAASGRGIPSRWAHFHGYLLDDQSHIPITRKYFKEAYLGCFLKTANGEYFKPLEDIEKKYDLVLVNTAGPRKNLQKLSVALRQLSDLKVAICGRIDDTSMAYFEGLDIEFLGHIEHGLNLILNQSRIGLIPSNEMDASPRVILEYMASGLPVLANERTAGISKFVLKGAGEICSIQEFPQRARQMLAHLDDYHPREVFNQNFTYAIVADSLAKHISSVQSMPLKSPKRSLSASFLKFSKVRLDDVMKQKNDKDKLKR